MSLLVLGFFFLITYCADSLLLIISSLHVHHSYINNVLNDAVLLPSYSHHCVPTPMDLAVQQTADEGHPCRVTHVGLCICCHSYGSCV